MSQENIRIVGQIPKNLTKSNGNLPTGPIYFSTLDVENFRCFGPKQTLDFSTKDGRPIQWTVILGENGVGKTSLLRLIADFQPTADKHKAFGKIVNVDSLSLPKLLAEVKWTIEPNGFQRRNQNLPELLSVTFAVAALGEKPSSDIPDLTLATNFDFDQKGGLGVKFGNIILLDMVCFGYGASRSMGKSNLSENREGENCASLFDEDAELLNAEEWLLQADYAASRKSPRQQQAVKQRDRIKDILISLLPDVDDIRIAEGEGNVSVPIVEFKTPYGWVRLQDLSLGYRALITWMVDLASRLFDRYPDSPDPLAEPAVVLVDEIDLHLHPRWQRTLMQFLSDIFKQTQFIVTAHSPLVVQAADENANIVLLRREGDHVVIENDKKSIRGWRVDQILTSDLFGLETARPPQYDEAIKERTALLSKGKLTKKDEARLAELEKQIDELPTGENPSDMEAMDIIRQAAELLKTK